MITAVLLGAADASLDGEQAAAHECAAGLAAEFTPTMLDGVARAAVEGLVTAAWHAGWLPYDLYQMAQRNRDDAAVAYLVDAIAAENRRYPAARLHPRWADQLRQIDAEPWWDPHRPHLTQWATRRELDIADALRAVIEVMALLRSLPVLPQILPLPGTAAPATVAPPRGVDQRVLTRVRALLAKAESTGYAEEAEALSAKAQQLMARHSLERAVVDAAGADGRQPATARRIWLDNPYVGPKAMLVDATASANRCRTVLYEKVGFITVIGDEVDLDAVELLCTSLLTQATRAMLAAGRQTTRTGQSRTRSFRQSFLVAYAARIRERLSTATEEAISATRADMGEPDTGEDSRLLPVLAARQRAVDELFDEMFPHLVRKSVSVSNARGYHAGRAAADLAVLDTRHSVSA
jgi:hypothetical protein